MDAFQKRTTEFEAGAQRLNLWTPSRRRRPSTCQASVLPEELLARGGGADAACLALAIHQGGALAIGQCGGVRGE